MAGAVLANPYGLRQDSGAERLGEAQFVAREVLRVPRGVCVFTLRADWFVATACQEPHAAALLHLPDTLAAPRPGCKWTAAKTFLAIDWRVWH